MELRANAINTVYLEGSPAWTVTATWSLNGVSQGSIAVTPNNGMFAITLPYLVGEGEVEINWTINVPGSTGVTRTDYYEVVTPILSIGEVQRIWEGSNEQEAIDIEASVRQTIQAHTGQSFGNHTGTKMARGTGQAYLALPARLISFTELSGFPYNYNVSIVGDGWYLAPQGGTAFIPPTRADAYGINNHDFEGINRQFGVPIKAPSRHSPYNFLARQDYYITGTWGWKYVPAPVREAAKLLVNDYASGDNVYRDRYLTSMTAADWRIQFNSGAFAKTGNARADHLLSDYVLTRGWAVL